MKGLSEFILNEKSSKVFKPQRNKWTKFDVDKLSDEEKKELSSEFLELINTAYAPIGGHVNFKSEKDVFGDKDLDFWEGIDIHGTNDFDLIVFGKKTKYGIKYTGVGHDGEKDSKKTYLEARAKMLHQKGYYIEISGNLASIMINKYDVPVVDNQEDVEKVLGKKVTWLGKSSEKDMPGNGWYSRVLGSHTHEKILVGRPVIKSDK
jgi:hypothetical protein